MLKPQANAHRDLVSLDGVWNFTLDGGLKPWQRWIPSTLQVPVPASYNDIFIDPDIRNHVGWAYYQRSLTVPSTWSQQRYFLRFDAATHQARVYICDHLVAEHVGGYTPFEVDITNIVYPGCTARLTVGVNNELDWHTIPPGRLEALANGTKKQQYQHESFNYAGLERSVWLYSVPSIFINDITVVTRVKEPNGFAEPNGFVDFEVSTNVPLRDCTVEIMLFDEDGYRVTHSFETKGTMSVTFPRLWQPGTAYLYRLRATIYSSSPTSIDRYELPVGFRTVTVSGNRFLINGKPFYFTSFGKHEDTPIRGKGHDPAYMIHDFQLMKWMGANSFRTAHYPYAEEVLEYADRHGLVVINETAAVGLDLATVAGLSGQKPAPTFSPDTINEEMQKAHKQAIRELIARDKNHPCVVMWTIANEPAASEPGVREYMEPLVTLTKELDPTRPVCFTNENQAKVHTDLITDLFDVICLNRYYGWYLDTGDLEAAEKGLEECLLSWGGKYNKPIIMTGYGADTVAGLNTVGDGKEYQSKVLEMSHRVFDRVDSVVGEHVWNFADFQTPSTFPFRVDGSQKEVSTRDPRPKGAVQVLKKRWTEMVQKQS